MTDETTVWAEDVARADDPATAEQQLAAAADALLAEIDQRRSAGDAIPLGYRMGIALLSAVRARVEELTGEDLSDTVRVIYYREVPLFYSTGWIAPLSFVAR